MQHTELVAGRTLDALIEERIFGNPIDHEFDEPIVKARRDQYDECGILPAYSTDMAAAWQIVEKLDLLDYWYLRHRAQWEVFETDQGDREHILATADTAPLVLCRAALLRVRAAY